VMSPRASPAGNDLNRYPQNFVSSEASQRTQRLRRVRFPARRSSFCLGTVQSKKASQYIFATPLDSLSRRVRVSRQSASSSSIRVNSGILLCRTENLVLSG
jgi:hypothetical protein